MTVASRRRHNIRAQRPNPNRDWSARLHPVHFCRSDEISFGCILLAATPCSKRAMSVSPKSSALWTRGDHSFGRSQVHQPRYLEQHSYTRRTASLAACGIPSSESCLLAPVLQHRVSNGSATPITGWAIAIWLLSPASGTRDARAVCSCKSFVGRTKYTESLARATRGILRSLVSLARPRRCHTSCDFATRLLIGHGRISPM